MAKVVRDQEPARIIPGSIVTVNEDPTQVIIRSAEPWTGRATSVKWSSVSGWYVDVTVDDVGTYVIRQDDVTAVRT